MKKSLLVIIVLIVVSISGLFINALRFPTKQVEVGEVEALDLEENLIAQRLAEAVRFRTVSHQDPQQFDGEEFLAFHRYLERTFPKVHSALRKEVVGGYSLLYTWEGRDCALKPILFVAHQDVVPVESISEASWQKPPFDGQISDGFIWGRGAMDNKAPLVGMLEAVEILLAEGFQPERTVLLAFGHDEELGGYEGAAKSAALLQERNVELEYVLDEGLVISDGAVPVPMPAALVGIAEKGYVSVELTAESGGGHSAMPPAETAIGILARAVESLEENQMPGGIRGVVRQTFDHLGPEMPFSKRLVVANLWLFEPLVERQLSASPTMNASLRTTTAPTILAAGLKENILPTQATAVVNFRILPGDTIESVIAHVRRTISDPRVKVGRYGKRGWEPSAISDIGAPGFRSLERTIRQVFPDAIVAPALVPVATDSRHFANLTSNIYRFLPQRYGPDDMKRYHGIDERISLENYAQGVRFYYHLIRNSPSGNQ